MDSVSFVISGMILCAIWDPRRTETAFVMQQMLKGVDLNILKDKIGKNTVVSSFAFRLPLCKLAAAASGATRHEIISILDIHTLSETKTCYSSLFPTISTLLETDLTSLNKIYVNYTHEIDESFILGSQAYGVTVSMIGYDYRKEAVEYVNREFSSKTYMRIKDVLELKDIDEYSSILLVNGFHYKGTWESPFTQTKTKTEKFRSGKKTLKIEMMQNVMQCFYLDDAKDKFKAISLRLTQAGMYITFVLPYHNSNIMQLINTMSQNQTFVESINKRMQWKFIKVALPRFKIKTTIDWTPYLKQIGLNLTTNMENTGLNGILKDEESGTNMYLSKAKQRIFVEIDEGPIRNKHVGPAETPQVNPELEQPETPAMPIGDFTVDGPFFFTVALTVRQTKRNQANQANQANKVFQVLSGIFYGPQ